MWFLIRILILGVALYVINTAKIVFVPLVFACVLAILINPVLQHTGKWIRPSYLNYGLGLTLFAGLFGAAFYWVGRGIFTVFSTLETNNEDVDRTLNEIDQSFDLELMRGNGYLDSIRQWIKEGSEHVLSTVTEVVGVGSELLGGILLTFIFAFFILSYKDHFRKNIIKAAPDQAKQKIEKVVDLAPLLCRSYFIGTLKVMVVLFLANTLLFWLVDLKYALVWGAVVGGLAFIPFIGTAIGLILPLSYSLVSTGHWEQPAIILLGYVVIQQLEGNILTPKIVGQEVELNALFALVGTLLGGLAWGVPGAVIALPFMGILRRWLLMDPKLSAIGNIMGAPGSNEDQNRT